MKGSEYADKSENIVVNGIKRLDAVKFNKVIFMIHSMSICFCVNNYSIVRQQQKNRPFEGEKKNQYKENECSDERPDWMDVWKRNKTKYKFVSECK